jgi:predicted Zn-dependent protease
MATDHFPSRTWKYVVWVVVLLALGSGLYLAGRQGWVYWHYQAALRAMERRQFEEALQHLRICLREWPDSAETRFLAARTARRAGQLDDAQRWLKEAEGLGWVRPAIELENALTQVQRGNYRTVSPALLSFIRRGHPDSLLIVEVLAPVALANFEVALAEECLDVWIERDPHHVKPRLLKADILQRIGAKRQAYEQYQEVLRLDPDNVEARRQCGWFLLEQKQADEAKRHFDHLWQSHPDDPAVMRGMAYCLHHLGQDEEAGTILDRLLKAHPDDGMALSLRGLIELDAGRPEQAESWLRRAAALMPYEMTIAFNYARCLETLGKTEEAQKIRERTKQIEADMRAVSALVKDAAARPHDPEPRYQIAERMMRNGMENEARRWLESALAQNPTHKPSHELLARYFEQLGDLSRAAEHRKIAASLTEPK